MRQAAAHPGGGVGVRGRGGVLLTQLAGGWSLPHREELGSGALGQ